MTVDRALTPERVLALLHAGPYPASGWLHLRAAAGDEIAAGEILWEMARAGTIPSDRQVTCWYHLAHAGAAFGAGDVRRLLSHRPEDRELREQGWRWPWITELLAPLCAMIERLPAEAADLVEAREVLPALHRELLTFALVLHGHLPTDATARIPAAPLARLLLDTRHPDPWLMDAAPQALGAARWHRALGRQARRLGALEHPGLLLDAVTDLPPPQAAVIALAQDNAARIVELLEAAGPAVLPLLRNHPGEIPALLMLVRADPAPWLGEIERRSRDISYCGSEVPLRRELAWHLPVARLEALLPDGWFHWPLASVCPTPAVLARAISEIRGWPSSPRAEDMRWAHALLERAGHPAALREALGSPPTLPEPLPEPLLRLDNLARGLSARAVAERSLVWPAHVSWRKVPAGLEPAWDRWGLALLALAADVARDALDVGYLPPGLARSWLWLLKRGREEDAALTAWAAVSVLPHVRSWDDLDHGPFVYPLDPARGRVGADAIPALIWLLERVTIPARLRALGWLADHAPEKGAAALRRGLEDPDRHVRQRCRWALESAG